MEQKFQKMTELIREAGRIMLAATDVESENNVGVKPGDANFVTVYDVAVQTFLLEKLGELFPEAVFIAEEQENDPAALSGELCFLIDPIDGTTNFIRDYRHSAISVALFSKGEPLFGAVYDPYLNEMFCAVKGKGAYLNGHPMQVICRPLATSIVSYGTALYYKDTLTEQTFAIAKDLFAACADLRRCGSAALDLAYLAAGRSDLFFEARLSPWDIAAGALLITEAGGVISDMKGASIDFSAPSSVIAATPVAYPFLLETVQKY